ncbi:porin [Roseiarcaceae bacterium H3SJ34-1]|uniref:porin n=1 Tax=Terripilifer ovatus TaxID=3032367 RepID=UPI003AB96663|nr:porin [Roseiarcaceae bacterium H3SJ34-1]
MTFTKSLLLGSSAVLLAVAGAQAADLPSRKAAPVEYVRVCDAYGAGFYWIPGTDTCLKVGGRVRVDTWYTPAKSAVQMRSTGGPAFTGAPTPGLPGAGVAGSSFTSANGVDQLGWYARGYIMMDARTQSAWGTVQTAVTLRLSAATGLAQASQLGSTPLAVAGATGATIEAAYIRFAGFTIGDAASNFTFLPTANNFHSIYSAQFTTGIRQFAYTATFGGGFSATVALENRGDASTTQTANALGFNPWSATASTATVSGPQRLPALVGNLRVDQGWGSAMVSAMVQQNTANFATPAAQAVTNGLGPLVTKTGWAVSGGVKINLPMLAAGDSVQAWVAYGVGALSYVAIPNLNSNTIATANYLGGFLRGDRDMTIYCAGAGCLSYGAEQTAALNVAGIFTHYWTPSLRSNFIASYLRVTPGRVTRNTDWTNGGLSEATAWSVQSNLIWSPVKNFDIGVELSYARLQQSLTGLNGGLPTAVPCTAAAPMCNASISPSNWTGRMRVERTF